jgi:high-affinity iron transporter
MRMYGRLRLFALGFALLGAVLRVDAQEGAQTVLHLLDYIGVDYSEAVADGKVKNADEYKEMLEFGAQVRERMRALPDNPSKATLARDAESLAALIEKKSAPAAVSEAASRLRWALVAAYRLKLAPRVAPDLARGKALYSQNCAACHGAEGRGDGPAAKGLDPAPSNFHDLERMAQRSAYGLYNTISLGVDGTSMAPFRQLSEEDRWALAFLVSVMGTPQARIAEGERLWKAGEARSVFPDLDKVATLSTNEVMQGVGAQAARVQDYLRAHPEAVAALKPAPIAFARAKLAEAQALYEKGDRAGARDAAMQGYLEGFELAEASLANTDAALMRDIERAMLELRGAIEQGVPAATLASRIEAADRLLATAEEKLGAGSLSAGAAFTSSLLILLREGLEAILVLAAIIAFVVKSGRRDALVWVHAGWIAALVLGAITWFAATFLIEISGAKRELTEGFTALFAAAMLLYVGYWLHGKSYAKAWARFIREQVGQALARRTLLAMAAVSFLAVYREMFEIVLFYQALWVQAGEDAHGAVLGGMAAALAALAIIGFAIFKYSLRLPIGLFFGATSALLALLALVFAGHGVAALQEAGVIGATPLGFDSVPLLGIYPTGESLGLQAAVLALIVISFLLARRASVRAVAAN